MSMATIPYGMLAKAPWNLEALIVRAGGAKQDQVTLGELARFNRRTLSPSEVVPDDTYNYVELSGISRDTGLIEKVHSGLKGIDLPTRARLLARAGDILVPLVRPGQGAVAMVPPELDGCLASTGFAVLTPRAYPGEALYFVLRSEQVNFDFEKMAAGAIPAITLQDLKDYPLPLKKELSSGQAEEASALYREWCDVNALPGLGDVADRVFKEKLKPAMEMPPYLQEGYYLMDYGRLRDVLHPAYYMSPLDGFLLWPCSTESLGNLVSFKLFGFTPVKHLYEEEPGPGLVPYIRSVNIRREQLELTLAAGKTVYVEAERMENYEQKMLEAHDLVVVTRGPYLGRCALVQEGAAGAIMNQNLTAIKCSERILPQYLACFLKTGMADGFFEALTPSFHLPVSQLRELVVPLPPLEVQREIVSAVLGNPAYRERENTKEEIACFVRKLVR